MVLDDRKSGDYLANTGTSWRLVTDGVMGGVSRGTLSVDTVEGRDCLHLQGMVSLENNGGFIQCALDLATEKDLDGSQFEGISIDVYGNNETYNIHLRTSELWFPWQSYRADITALPHWQNFRLPFRQFTPYRTGNALDLTKLKRIGVVAIGRVFQADLCIAQLSLY